MPRTARYLLLAGFGCALLLVPLALLAYSVSLTATADADILRRLAEHDFGTTDAVASAVVLLGDPLPFVVLLTGVAVLGFTIGRWRETVAALVVVAGASLTTQILKQLLEHQRIVSEFTAFNQPWADAFPSGHTTAAASLAVALTLVAPTALRPLAMSIGAAFVVAMGLSVVVLQWHYPSDVLGGILVVASWTFVALAVLQLLYSRDPDSPSRRHGERSSSRFAVPVR